MYSRVVVDFHHRTDRLRRKRRMRRGDPHSRGLSLRASAALPHKGSLYKLRRILRRKLSQLGSTPAACRRSALSELHAPVVGAPVGRLPGFDL
jgi:hypothetical protein